MPGPASMSEAISGFDPRSVPDCIVWLDAADISSLTLSGTNVTGWRDKSIYGNNVNSISATPPTYSSADSSINFVANSSTFLRGALSATYSNATVFMVVSIATNPAPAFPRLSILSNSGTLNSQLVGQLFIVNANNPGVLVYLSTGTNPTGQGTNIITYVDNVTFNTRQLISNASTYNGTNYTVSTLLNGNTQTFSSTSGTFTPNSAYTATYNKYTLGNYADASAAAGDALQGKIFEYIVFSRELSTIERQQIEGYLAWKWSLQNSSQSFTPSTSISGCLLWLDGADTSTTSMTQSSGTVSVWKDKSGNGYNFTQLYSSLPTITTITRQTGIFFAANQALRNTTLPFPTTYTIFAVANQTGSPSGYAYILHSPYNADHIIFFGTFSGTRNFATFAGPVGAWNDLAANTPNTNVATTSSTASVLCCTNNGTTLTPYINGNIMNTKTGTNAAATGMIIGDTYISGQPWLGTIGEIIVYNSILSTAQRQQVEIYLSRKWGVSVPTNALSLSQPFSSIRPFSRYFNPIDIQGCVLWLDAADSSTTGGGSTLTTWLDKSGNGNTATSGSGTIAVSSTGLTFNGSTNYMTIAGLAGAIANTSFVIFIVETFTGTSGYYFGDDNVNAGTNSALHIGYRSQTNQTFAFYSNDLEDYAVSGSNIRRVWTLWLPTGANRVTRRNGAVDVTLGNSNRLLSFTAPRIGRVFGGNYYPGIISEILVYTTDIGLQNVLPIEGYLAWKWGLQASLPVTHPFSKFPPSSALPFSPTNISNCQLWMDAAQDTSANNATITTIPDRSANGSNLTAIGTITFLQNNRNGNPVYYFGGSRASNANFNWGTSFTHFVVSSSVGGTWLNSVGTLTSYVGLGNWALANINSAVSFVDPGSITTWTISGSVTTGVSASGLPFVTLPGSSSIATATTTYTTPINSARQTSFSLVLPSTAGLYSYFGLTNGTTTLQFLLNTSGGVPSNIYFFFGGNPVLNVVAGSTVLCKITNTSLYMIVYPSGSNVTVSWTNSGSAEYSMYFSVLDNNASANTTTYTNIQFDPAQGDSVLPKTTGLANAWNITSVGYTSGSTTLTNYAVNGTPRSSTTSTAHSGQTPVLPLYIGGSSSGNYDTNTFAEIIHYNVALPTAQRQQVEGYLAAKWGISLPTTHPYRNFQPATTSVSLTVVVPIVTANLIVNLDPVSYTASSTSWPATVGNTWTFNSAPTIVSTSTSVALSFNGSQYVMDQTGFTTGPSSTNSFTIEVWFFAAANLTNNLLSEMGQAGAPGSGWNVSMMYIVSNIINAAFWVGGVHTLSLGSYTANTWTQACYTYSGTTVTGYKNGVFVSSNTATKQYPGRGYYCLAGAGNPIYSNTVCSIGGCKIYSSVLSAADVKQNYNAYAPRFGLSPIP
jgi:hypothetical protein